MSKHVPTPWRLSEPNEMSPNNLGVRQFIWPAADSDDPLPALYDSDEHFCIATVNPRASSEVMNATAEFIVKACNNHDGLVAALREIAEDPHTHEATPIGERYERLLAAAHAALAKAGA